MWLWILSGLFLALLWGMWFLLRPSEPGPAAELLPTWIPVVATIVIVLLLVGLIVYRRIRAARAARALEKAIAQQAQEQALNAKPERVAEIQELHRQIQAGINALKASKLGGGRSGNDALYTLPWYAMVGPPGAGKTTALRHSGLVFPFLDPAGGGVRGVGGTRNCDWWFTNEAILLDTAGRYTTEADDHDEWMAFLEQLLKFRSHKPLNGVIVAVSITDLLDGTEEQIQQIGRKVRARVDEMQATLHMVLPVYVLFTKCDLIAGFSEYFGDFKKSERSQAWGATLRLDTDKSDPARLFDAEFDTMVERLHDHGLRRLITERSRDTKEKVYQFPLEFAAIKRNLSDFLAAFLAPSAGEKVAGSGQPGGGYPIFRGFYFTSGTQEGRPLDRVVGAMGRAFGLKSAASDEIEPKALESKSYFLRDVFTNVIFPDQDIAARTAAEIRRQMLQRYGAAAVALVIALLFLIPACISFGNNKALVAKTGQVSQDAAQVQWGEPTDALPKIDKLDSLREQAETLQQFEESTPITYGWFMYQGDKLFRPTVDQYIHSLKQGFVDRVKDHLENELRKANNKQYLENYDNLKTYLLLDDKYKVFLPDEAEAQKNRLTQLWANLLRPHTDLSETDLKQKLAPHVAYYVKLLQSPIIKGEPTDGGLVESTRDILRKVGPTQRFYDHFVTSLVDQKYDPNGPTDDPENLKYPPVSLKDMFRDRPEVLTKVRSGQKERTGKWFAVQGPYTSKGHAQVIASLQEDHKILEREKWVVPPTSEERDYASEVQKSLDRVRMDYNAEYITQWVNFFRDIQVEEPPNNKEAIAEFRILATPDWPYLRLLRALDDATQFAEKEEAAQNALQADGGVVDQLKTKLKNRIQSKTGVKVDPFLGGGSAGEARDPIPDKFKSMVRFGVSAPVKDGQPPPPPPSLAKYVGLLEGLAAEMGVIEDGPPSSETAKVRQQFEDAVRTTDSLLLGMDETGQDLMKPLLMNPLKLGFKAVVRSAGGAASGLWEVAVWPTYRDKIKDRYPFNLASSRDASFEDAVAFFKPKDGILWGFYDQFLKPFHSQIGHDFVPISHLTGSRSAKPYTPFNPNMYNCLQRADEITDALFGAGAPGTPQVAFQLNLKTVSPIVSDVIFEVDGQVRHYRNEKPFWHEFAWPGEKPTGARILVRGAGGLEEEVVREGRWGLFRLFEAATTTAKKDSDDVFTVTWQMTAPPVTVVMEVRPTRGNHPFPSSFFRATNCPPSIGDRLGKGS